jgi:hypothetical protein
MKKIKTSEVNKNTEIYVMDEPGAGGAYHEYLVELIPVDASPFNLGDEAIKIKFQKGPIPENGVNGLQIEDLLEIAKHRLECFQEGPFPCEENSLALNSIEGALAYLNQRTIGRRKRGVEGKSEE